MTTNVFRFTANDFDQLIRQADNTYLPGLIFGYYGNDDDRVYYIRHTNKIDRHLWQSSTLTNAEHSKASRVVKAYLAGLEFAQLNTTEGLLN